MADTSGISSSQASNVYDRQSQQLIQTFSPQADIIPDLAGNSGVYSPDTAFVMQHPFAMETPQTPSFGASTPGALPSQDRQFLELLASLQTDTPQTSTQAPETSSAPTPFEQTAIYDDTSSASLWEKLAELEAQKDPIPQLMDPQSSDTQALPKTSESGIQDIAWSNTASGNLVNTQGIRMPIAPVLVPPIESDAPQTPQMDNPNSLPEPQAVAQQIQADLRANYDQLKTTMGQQGGIGNFWDGWKGNLGLDHEEATWYNPISWYSWMVDYNASSEGVTEKLEGLKAKADRLETLTEKAAKTTTEQAEMYELLKMFTGKEFNPAAVAEAAETKPPAENGASKTEDAEVAAAQGPPSLYGEGSAMTDAGNAVAVYEESQRTGAETIPIIGASLIAMPLFFILAPIGIPLLGIAGGTIAAQVAAGTATAGTYMALKTGAKMADSYSGTGTVAYRDWERDLLMTPLEGVTLPLFSWAGRVLFAWAAPHIAPHLSAITKPITDRAGQAFTQVADKIRGTATNTVQRQGANVANNGTSASGIGSQSSTTAAQQAGVNSESAQIIQLFPDDLVQQARQQAMVHTSNTSSTAIEATATTAANKASSVGAQGAKTATGTGSSTASSSQSAAAANASSRPTLGQVAKNPFAAEFNHYNPIIEGLGSGIPEGFLHALTVNNIDMYTYAKTRGYTHDQAMKMLYESFAMNLMLSVGLEAGMGVAINGAMSAGRIGRGKKNANTGQSNTHSEAAPMGFAHPEANSADFHPVFTNPSADGEANVASLAEYFRKAEAVRETSTARSRGITPEDPPPTTPGGSNALQPNDLHLRVVAANDDQPYGVITGQQAGKMDTSS
ncbi:MAG: hypothetical protein KTR14_09130 [Vampirovibrio sp.]|nr:hypothetical protein [Vampirovibrio sp.]